MTGLRLSIYRTLGIGLLGIGLSTHAQGQVVNPADAAGSSARESRRAAQQQQPPTQRELELERRVEELERIVGSQTRPANVDRPAGASSQPPPALPPSSSETATPHRLRSWELPPVDVVGEGSGLREEERVGSYEQPRWTTARRFPGTRVYVIPEGKVEVEYWLRPTIDGGDTEIRSLYEIEIGLPHRFQLDLYLRTDQEGDDSEMLLGSQLQVEFKLLLGDEIAPRLHWGVNIAAELETGGEREYEYQFTAGISYTVIDEKFSVGAEMESFFADVRGDRGDFSQTYYVGPSFQYRPTPAFRINFAPLVGIGPDAGDFRAYLNLGYEF